MTEMFGQLGPTVEERRPRGTMFLLVRQFHVTQVLYKTFPVLHRTFPVLYRTRKPLYKTRLETGLEKSYTRVGIAPSLI